MAEMNQVTAIFAASIVVWVVASCASSPREQVGSPTDPAEMSADTLEQERATTAAQSRVDHRDELTLNFISGGNFRNYISEHIREQDHWAHSMRMFGTFHNHMHEMMTDLTRHARDAKGHGALLPAFAERISGGDWTAYREALESSDEDEAWTELVLVAEVMHDRVHHAMYKSVAYDIESRGRDVELADYADDAEPFVSLDREELSFELASMEAFRELAWHGHIEGAEWHGAIQGMMVFDEMLYAIMTDWAAIGAGMEAEACRPPAFEGRITRAQWLEYERRVDACDDRAWRELVVVTGLMHDRIHHLMHAMMVYAAETAESAGT